MRRVGILLSIVLVSVTQAPAVSKDQGDPRQDAQQASARIRQLQVEADTLARQSATLLTELRKLEVERQIKVAELKRADAELLSVSAALTDTAARVQALEAERQAETPWVRDRLVALYKRGRFGSLGLLLASNDLRQIGRVSRGLAAIAGRDRMRLESHRETTRLERAALAKLEGQKQMVEAARTAAVAARQALDRAAAAGNRRLDELDERRDLAARYIGELQQAQVDLQRSVSALPGRTPILPIGPFKGSLDWPATGRLLSRFGRSTADRFGSTIVRNGIEIATEEGTPVRAVHAGTVAYAAPFTGFGTLVIVDHGGNAFTLYGHLSRASVTSGGRVGRTDVVGYAGRTPGGIPATYFELRIDGRPVDPVQWLRSQR